MFYKFCRLFLLSLGLSLSLLSGSSAKERAVVSGTFYDCRYGDILLGAYNLTLAPQAQIMAQNIVLPVSKLDKKYARMIGCAHLNEFGQVIELHLEPKRPLHKPSCNFAFLSYGPQTDCLGGEPVFARFYSAEFQSAPDFLQLYIDGRAIESGQIKHHGLIYYPAALSAGRHTFRLEVRRAGLTIGTLQWTTYSTVSGR